MSTHQLQFGRILNSIGQNPTNILYNNLLDWINNKVKCVTFRKELTLPIHFICQYSINCNNSQLVPFIQWYFQSHIDQVEIPNLKGLRPAHLICEYQSDYQLIFWLIESKIVNLYSKTNNGRSVFHHLILNKYLTIESKVLLIDSWSKKELFVLEYLTNPKLTDELFQYCKYGANEQDEINKLFKYPKMRELFVKINKNFESLFN
jgi:hypothetical protein